MEPELQAILGAGGVGGFVGAVLAGGGERVLLLLRAESLPGHPPALTLDSPFGHLDVPVEMAASLDQEVDILWVATKATQLEAALQAVPNPALARMVVPLLNGVDHIARLRAWFGAERVLPATIAGELERTAPGRIVHRSAFASFGFGAAGERRLARVAEILTGFGCGCRFEADELTLLWRKLVMLAPMALNTTAARRTVGELWADPEWSKRVEAAAREACAVALALGAAIDVEATLGMLRSLPGTLRSSMQKDVAAGRPPELDAIAGPILRGGAARGIPVPVTTELAAMIRGPLSPA